MGIMQDEESLGDQESAQHAAGGQRSAMNPVREQISKENDVEEQEGPQLETGEREGEAGERKQIAAEAKSEQGTRVLDAREQSTEDTQAGEERTLVGKKLKSKRGCLKTNTRYWTWSQTESGGQGADSQTVKEAGRKRGTYYNIYKAMTSGRRLFILPVIQGKISCMKERAMRFEIVPQPELRDGKLQEWAVSVLVRAVLCEQHHSFFKKVGNAVLKQIRRFSVRNPVLHIQNSCPEWIVSDDPSRHERGSLYEVELRALHNSKETRYRFTVSQYFVLKCTRTTAFSSEELMLKNIAVAICDMLYRDSRAEL